MSIEYAKKVMEGDLLDSGDPTGDAGAMFETLLNVAVATDADGDFAATLIGCVPENSTLISAHFVSATGTGASGSNYFKLQINKRDAAAAQVTAIASFDTSATAITANQARPMTVDDTKSSLVAGGALEVQGVKTGTGAVLGAGILTVRLRRR